MLSFLLFIDYLFKVTLACSPYPLVISPVSEIEVFTNLYAPIVLTGKIPPKLLSITDKTGPQALPYRYLKVEEVVNTRAKIKERYGKRKLPLSKEDLAALRNPSTWLTFTPNDLTGMELYQSRFPLKISVTLAEPGRSSQPVRLIVHLSEQSIATQGMCQFRPYFKTKDSKSTP